MYGAPAPAGYANADDKNWSLIAHFGGVLSFIPPLIVFLVKGPQSPTVRAHAVAALNFQLVCWGAMVLLSIVRVCVGLFLPDLLATLFGLVQFCLWAGSAVFAVLAGLKANSGELYRYPIPVKLVS